MASGIWASDCVGMDSPVSLRDIVAGRSTLLDDDLRRVLSQKWEAGNAIDMVSPPAALLRAAHNGDGFPLDDAHPEGWPTDVTRATVFYPLPLTEQYRGMHRIMSESALAATQNAAPDRYRERYEKMLRRPLPHEGKRFSIKRHPREASPAKYHQACLNGSGRYEIR
jgi:hypothetical protein